MIYPRLDTPIIYIIGKEIIYHFFCVGYLLIANIGKYNQYQNRYKKKAEAPQPRRVFYAILRVYTPKVNDVIFHFKYNNSNDQGIDHQHCKYRY